MTIFPYEVPALKVEQPIGTFYVAVLPADLLLQVVASDAVVAKLNDDGIGYSIHGMQRLIQDKRLTQIADYIDREDSTFPNSLILAANYGLTTGYDSDEEADLEQDDDASEVNSEDASSWTIEERDQSYVLKIPTNKKLAAIVDGQHRLFAFAYANPKTRLEMPLICSVFLDLPKPLQAQIFATINTTQKSVDRSLTYELFGYNIADEPSTHWSPDKLAVFLTRKLATDERSPLRGRIAVAPKRDNGLQQLVNSADWKVSTAVIVDGILRLISSNPKRDSNAMHTATAQPRSILLAGPKDKTILRQVYIGNNDKLIYTVVENYLIACDNLFWAKANPNSFIFRTAGIMALFDVLRKIVPDALMNSDVRVEYFSQRLARAAAIDFSQEPYRNTSGSGRIIIRRAIEALL